MENAPRRPKSGENIRKYEIDLLDQCMYSDHCGPISWCLYEKQMQFWLHVRVIMLGLDDLNVKVNICGLLDLVTIFRTKLRHGTTIRI